MFLIQRITTQDLYPTTFCDYSQLSRQIVSSEQCTFQLQVDYKELNHYDNTTFDNQQYDFGVVNINYLMPTELNDNTCSFSGLYGLDQTASLKNAIVTVDADVDLAGQTCQQIYISLFDNILGKLENITAVGQIRIRNATSSQTITVSDMFGYVVNQSSQFVDLSSSVTFYNMSSSNTNNTLTPVHQFSNTTITVDSASQLSALSQISVYAQLDVKLPYTPNIKQYQVNVYSALGFQNENRDSSTDVKFVSVINYVYSFMNLVQMTQWTQQCKQINIYQDTTNQVLSFSNSYEYLTTLYVCPNITYYTKSGQDQEGVLNICTGSANGYLDVQTLQCISSCPQNYSSESLVCYPDSLGCPFNLITLTIGQQKSCVYECQKYAGYIKSDQNDTCISQQIDETTNCSGYIYGTACYEFCPYGVKISEQTCLTPQSSDCRQNNQYLIQRSSLPTICVDECPLMLYSINNLCSAPCVGTSCQSNCDSDEYVVQFPIRSDDVNIYCADKCNNFTVSQPPSTNCQSSCDEGYLKHYQIGLCVTCLDGEYWFRTQNQCVTTCEYVNNTISEYLICESDANTTYCPRYTNSTIDPTQKICSKECTADQIASTTAECISTCENYVNSNETQCVDSCVSSSVKASSFGLSCIENNEISKYCSLPNSKILDYNSTGYSFCSPCEQGELTIFQGQSTYCNTTEEIENMPINPCNAYKNYTYWNNTIGTVCYDNIGNYSDCPLVELKTIEQQEQKWCISNCTNGLVNETFVCKASCDSEKKIDDQNTCQDNCTTSFYQYVSDAVGTQILSRYHCVATCDGPRLQVPGESIYECGTQCKDLGLNVDQTSIYMMRTNKLCVDSCVYYTYNAVQSICEDYNSDRNTTSCPFYQSVDDIANVQYQCLQQCPINTVSNITSSLEGVGRCESACRVDTNLQLFYTQNLTGCVSSCNTSQFYQQQTRLGESIFVCASSCPSPKFSGIDDISSTVNRCETYCSQFNNQLYGVVSGSSRTCQSQCPSNQKFYSNYVCSTNCSDNTYVDSSTFNEDSPAYVCIVCANEPELSGDVLICLGCQDNEHTKIVSNGGTITVSCSSDSCTNQNEFSYKFSGNILQCIAGGLTCQSFSTNERNQYQDMKYTEGNQCVSDCSNNNPFLNNSINTCINSCPGNTYVVQNGMEVCQTCSYYSIVNQTAYLCDDCNTPSKYIWNQNECRTTPCYQENKYTIKNNSYNFCVDQCSSQSYNYYYDSTLMICTNDCSSSISYGSNEPFAYNIINGQKQCVSQCPTASKYYKLDQSLSQEDYQMYQCVQMCDSSEYIQNIYMNQENTNKQQCIEECQDGYFIEEESKRCDQSCTQISGQLRYFYVDETKNANVCVEKCYQTYKFLSTESECKQQCDYAVSLSLSEQSSSGALYLCQQQCQNYRELINVFGYNVYYCIDGCSEGLLQNKNNIYANDDMECVSSCGDLYVQDRQCVSQCNQQYAVDNQQKICSLICTPYIIIDQQRTCTSTCTNFYQNSQNNRQECVDQCPNGEYSIISNKKTCQICSSYKILQDNITESYQCIDSCITNIHSVVNEYCWEGECSQLQESFAQSQLSQYIYTDSGNICQKQCAQLYQVIKNQQNVNQFMCISAGDCNNQKVFIDYGMNRLCTQQCNNYISASSADTYSGISQCVEHCPDLSRDQSQQYLYADIVNNVKICRDTCDSQYYQINEDYDYICTQQCNTFIQQNQLRQCVQSCSGNYQYSYVSNGQTQCLRSACNGLYIQDLTCVETCNSLIYQLQEDGSQVCQQQCDGYRLVQNSSTTARCIQDCSQYQNRFIIVSNDTHKWCNTSCPETKQFVQLTQEENKTIATCTEQCIEQDGLYYFIKYMNGTNMCVTQCDDGMDQGSTYMDMIVEDQNVICTDFCPEEQPYFDQQWNCVASCGNSFYTQDIKCQDKCDGTQASMLQLINQIQNKICVTSCYENQLFLKINSASVQKYQCDECSIGFYRENNGEYECIYNCEEDQFYDVEKDIFGKSISQCVDSCPSKIYVQKQCLSENLTCISQGYLFQVIENGYTSCISNCPEELPVIKSLEEVVCVAQCENSQVLDSTHQTFQVCRENCDNNGLILYQAQNKCVDDCYYTITSEYTRICTQNYSSCDENQTQIRYDYNGTDVCTSHCDQYIQGETCISECYTQYYYVDSQTQENICIESCQEPNIYYQQYSTQLHVCKDSCGDQYIESQSILQCVSSCSSNTYKLIGSQKVCQYSQQECSIYSIQSNLYVCVDQCQETAQYIENKLCQENCSQSNPYLTIGEHNICSSSCLTQKFIIESGIRKCVEKCNQDQVAVYTQVGGYLKCEYQCNGCTITKNDENYCHSLLSDDQCSLECNDPTPYILNQTCVKQCSQSYVIDQLTNICLQSQSECPMYYQNINGRLTCVTYCSGVLQVEQQQYQCTTSCQYYVQDQICVNECSSLIVKDNLCVDSIDDCQLYYINTQNIIQCVQECPSQYPYNKNGQCIQSCNPQFSVDNVCHNSCSQEINYYEDYVCQEDCDKQYYQITQYGKNCISTCTMKKISVTQSLSRCVSNCPQGYYTQVLNCVEDCSEGYIMNRQQSTCVTYCPSSQNYVTLIQDNKYECTASADCSFYAENIVNINDNNYILCKDQCEQGQYIVNTSYCVTQCPEHAKYISTNSILTCTQLCRSMEYLNVEGTSCQFSCPSDQFKQRASTNTSNNQCRLSCSTVQDTITMSCLTSATSCEYVEYKQGTSPIICVAQCSNNTYYQQQQIKYCIDVCNTTYYVMYNEEKQCQNECPQDTFNYKEQDSQYIQCVQTCSIYNQYNYNGVCQSSCPEGLEIFLDSCVELVQQNNSWINTVIILIVVFIILIIVSIVIMVIRRRRKHQKEMQDKRVSNRIESSLITGPTVTMRSNNTQKPKKVVKTVKKSPKESPRSNIQSSKSSSKSQPQKKTRKL